jgi:serine/threonine-protein kinase HipA
VLNSDCHPGDPALSISALTLCGNTHDHARNHAALWDGHELTLTPAYDICPQGRTGNEATQAMLITGENRYSQLKTCLAAAHHFLLSRQSAIDAIDRIETAIRQLILEICQMANHVAMRFVRQLSIRLR